jgi:hypothetical protein
MATRPRSAYTDTGPLKRYAKLALSRERNKPHMGKKHKDHMASVRTAEHDGHTIQIRTHYEITVDGKSVSTHLSVGNDGNLVCHALPNYLFSSAVDLVKTLIDQYPDEFPTRRTRRPRRGHGGHDHGGH